MSLETITRLVASVSFGIALGASIGYVGYKIYDSYQTQKSFEGFLHKLGYANVEEANKATEKEAKEWICQNLRFKRDGKEVSYDQIKDE